VSIDVLAQASVVGFRILFRVFFRTSGRAKHRLQLSRKSLFLDNILFLRTLAPLYNRLR
jgi:hypothetical protein